MSEQRTWRAIEACGKWLAFCLSIGWRKSDLDMLEKIWWQFHNERGELLNAGVQDNHPTEPTSKSTLTEPDSKRPNEGGEVSHSDGQVIKDGKKIAYYEYNGTSDIAISCLHDSEQGVVDEWREHEWKKCNCGEKPTDVLLYTSYGGGFYWPAQACLPCRAIVSGTIPYEDDIRVTDGHPLNEPHWADKYK